MAACEHAYGPEYSRVEADGVKRFYVRCRKCGHEEYVGFELVVRA